MSLTFAFSGGQAWAAPGDPLALTWEAPEGCPAGQAVMGNVQRLIADARVGRVPSQAQARVTVTAGETWEANLILDVGGTRTDRRFQAESCDAIAAAAALIIAVAVGADPAAAPQVEEPGPPVAPPRAPDEPSRAENVVAVDAVVDWGTMPRPPSAGFEAGAGRTWSAGRSRKRLVAGASFFPTRQLPQSSTEVFGDYWLLAVDARGCLGVAVWGIEVAPCAGAQVAIMHASTSVVTADMLPAVTRSWLSLLASAVAWGNISERFAAFVRADLVVPGSRPSFGNRSGEWIIPLYTIPASAFRAAVGLEFRFR